MNYLLCRQTAQTRGAEMENMEEMPMAGGTGGREEDAENYPHSAANARGQLRAAEAEAGAPSLP